MSRDDGYNQTFSYSRTWEDIESMLRKAERKQNEHYIKMQETHNRKERIFHMRNYKALEGVVKALRWTLGDRKVDTPLE
tara:strand:- start:1142 stop:1378 length:237 start_codon:yes stop_codon:yes gene_type:complete